MSTIFRYLRTSVLERRRDDATRCYDVTKTTRFPASPPATPDHKDLSMSKRFWKYQVEGWARRVRDYVKEFDIVEVTDSEGEADRGGNVDVEMSADSGGEAEANPGQTSSSGAAISNANSGSEAAMQLH